DVGGAPLQAPRYADLDGDGQPEALLLLPRERETSAPGVFHGVRLKSISLATGKQRWQAEVPADWQIVNHFQDGEMATGPDWPVAADLDGDGRAEVLVSSGAAGLVVLDGRTGGRLWETPPLPPKRKPAACRFLPGPDADGDGCRDVYRAMLFESEYRGWEHYL